MTMTTPPDHHSPPPPRQFGDARRWVETWRRAGAALEQVRRRELRALDVTAAIALLTGPADYTQPPRCPRESSGLVEQQRWFAKVRSRA